MGHEVGNALLQYYAKQLKLRLSKSDLAVRSGGDKFMVMLEDIKDIKQVDDLAQRLLAQLKVPVVI